MKAYFCFFLLISTLASAQISLTGSRYSNTVTSLGTSTNLFSSGFISSHYNTPRIVGLWDSSNNYKGVAWVRRFVSSTQLELEAPFIDKDGNTVNQVVGDQLYVSYNFEDVVTTNLTVNGDVVDLNDGIVFGIGNNTGVVLRPNSSA